MVAFDVARWRLPIKAEPGMWGHGTSLIAVPGTTSIVMSLPTGGPRSPWCVANVMTGEIQRGIGMPGHLRAIVFPPVEAKHLRPWILGVFGLGRLEFGPRPTVTDVVRKGIGKYQATLIDVDRDLLGVGHHRNASLLLVSKSDGSPVKRIRTAGPQVGYRLPDGRFRILGFHHAQVSDVDTDRRRVTARHRVPYGTGAIHVDDQVIVLLGDRQDFLGPYPDASIPSSGDETTLGWDVAPREVAVLDASTLGIRRRAPAPSDAVEILGVDRDGHVVVSTHYGFVLLEPASLTAIATHNQPECIAGAVLITGNNLIALLGGDRTDDALYAIRW